VVKPDPLEGHRGHELFQTWALYRRGGERTKSPVVTSGWSEPADVAHDAEPAWVVQIDHLIAYLTRCNEAYERILQRRYLEGLAIWEVAEKVQRTEGFVLLSLRAACDLADERVRQ
jgi:DNA-directed RNA polymerase specialized sigma24 family protein